MRRQIGLLLSFVLVVLPLAAVCYWCAVEAVIFRYSKLFSAMQFMLSTDREHYIEGISLLLRFVGALGGGLGLSILQCWGRPRFARRCWVTFATRYSESGS